MSSWIFCVQIVYLLSMVQFGSSFFSLILEKIKVRMKKHNG